MRRRFSPLAVLGVTTGLVVAALTLPAQVGATPVPTAPAGEEAPLAPTVVGDADVGIFAESRRGQNTASITPQIRMGLRPRPEAELHVSFGAVSVFRDGAQGREQEARPSNLSFGASHIVDHREGAWRYAKIGFAFVLPTAFATSAIEQDAYDYALGTRGGWDPWVWIPQSFGVVIPAEVRAQVGRRWVIGGDGGLAALLPSAGRTDGLAVAAQVAAEARVVTRWLGLGMRLAAVWNGRHPEDRSQASVSPFADISLCRRSSGRRIRGERARTSNACPVYASARLNVNLDGPYGFTGDDPLRVWGVQAGLGWAVY